MFWNSFVVSKILSVAVFVQISSVTSLADLIFRAVAVSISRN